ncbi:hypothetical protein Aconfl_41440 [Algoriphagus confluentis]|uniref:Uncharacterized protein n=1 Tax=Algoriphagus confluentis TaxID=1697556 RepID=A0ABQ6PU50_9BACT|nr:hypothetical protein Aconfl_41440 [Algoriphagus confluentis]
MNLGKAFQLIFSAKCNMGQNQPKLLRIESFPNKLNSYGFYRIPKQSQLNSFQVGLEKPTCPEAEMKANIPDLADTGLLQFSEK